MRGVGEVGGGGRVGDLAHTALRLTLGLLYRFFYRVRISGAANIPTAGPAILAANHISFFDSVVLGLSVPRRLSFVGKAEYMDSWKTRHVLPALGMIPIQRSSGREAMAALETACQVLEDNGLLGIYPEGTRSRDGRLHRGHTGVAHLAVTTGAPIVPVGLIGTDRIQPVGSPRPRPFHAAHVRFGEPLDPTAYRGGRRRVRQMLTDDLMTAIQSLCRTSVADDFTSGEPPLIRGGTESVYWVLGSSGASADDWEAGARAAVAQVCRRWDDARVGQVSGLECRVGDNGVITFRTDLKISVKQTEGGAM